MSFGKALYFPSIHFQDDNWVKYSLFFWDGLKRIVPEGFLLSDSPVVEALVAEGIIENVNPKDGKVPYTVGAAEQFMPTFEQMIERRRDMLTTETFVEELRKRERNTRVDIRKMDVRVVDALENYDFATKDGHSMIMDPALAGLYMVCLAGHISECQNAPLVTDTFEMETLGTYFQHSRVTQETYGNSDYSDCQLLRMLLPAPRPDNLDGLEIKKLIKFHKKYEAERNQFRKAVESVCEKVSGLDDPTAIKDFLTDKKKEIDTALTVQQNSMLGLGLGSAASLISLSIPASMSAIASQAGYLAPIFVPLIGALGLAVVGLSWLTKSVRDKQQAIRSCDWHYLLRLERQFDTAKIAKSSQEFYRQIIED